jgi:threonine dehydrogenase-like Zn-dependent dehydrogenase
MRTYLIPLAVVAALAGGTGVVMADSSPDKLAAAGSMSVAQVTSRLQSQGYTVSKIKFDDGRYKVKAVDASGHKQKLYVSPATGDVVSKGGDDD